MKSGVKITRSGRTDDRGLPILVVAPNRLSKIQREPKSIRKKMLAAKRRRIRYSPPRPRSQEFPPDPFIASYGYNTAKG